MGKKKRINGNLVYQFFQEWPCGPDWYIEEEAEGLLDENGNVILDSERKFDADDLGVLNWQGHGDVPLAKPFNGNHYVDVASYITWWEKSRTSETYLVTIPKDQLDLFNELAAQHGWKVS